MPRTREFDPQPSLKMDKVREVVEKERDAWLDENLVEVGDSVRRILNKGFTDLIKEMCGFRVDSWGRGKWEIDHCNGRSGNSLIGEDIKERVRGHLAEVIAEAINGVTLTKAQVEAVQTEYRQELARQVKEQARYRASDDARKVVEQLMAGEYEVREPKPKPTPKPKEAADDFFE